MLGLHDIEITSQALEVLAQLLVGDDALQVGVLTLVGISLTGKHEGQLLECHFIFALAHQLRDEVHIVHLLGDAHCLRVPLEFLEDVEGRSEGLLHLLGVGSVVGAGEQVVADTLEVVWSGVVFKFVEPFNLQKQINCLWLFVVVDELRNDLLHQLDD